MIVASNVDPKSDIHGSGHNFVVEAAPISVINLSGMEGESLTELNDSADNQAQVIYFKFMNSILFFCLTVNSCIFRMQK